MCPFLPRKGHLCVSLLNAKNNPTAGHTLNIDLIFGLSFGASITGAAVFLSLKIMERGQTTRPLQFGHVGLAPASEMESDIVDSGSFVVRTEEDEMTGQWRSLPGNVIELAATGFQIRFDADGTRPFHPFKLITPEGRCILDGAEGSLAEVQKLGESMAIDRSRFAHNDQPLQIHPKEQQPAGGL